MPVPSPDVEAVDKGERVQLPQGEYGALQGTDSRLDGGAVRGRKVAATVAAPGVKTVMMGKKIKRIWLRVDEVLFRDTLKAAEQDMRPIWCELRWLVMLGLSARRRLFGKENPGKRRQALSTAG